MKKTGAINLLPFSVLVIALALRMTSEGTANASYLVLAGYALLGRAQAIQALALSWLFAMLSEGIAPLASAAFTARYVVVASAAISVLLRTLRTKKNIISQIVLATLALDGFVILHSMLFSPIVEVSMLKAILWLVVMLTLLLAWEGMDSQVRARLERQLFGGMVLLALISLPLIFTGSIGYMRNGSGFQGVLNQPQAFGPTMALLGAWAIALSLAQPRPQWRNIALAGLCLTMVVLSEARTAGLALVLGVSIAATVTLLKSGLSVSKTMPGLHSGRVRVLAALAVIGVVISGTMTSDILGNYMSKGGRSEVTGIVEAYDESRGELITTMLDNIKLDPWIGVGFGIASFPEDMAVDYDPLLGMPISATIEKGVLPVAVLEELGMVGFVLFAAWLWMLLKRAGRGGVAQLALLVTILLFNLGESTLFSSGGFGLLPLILLAWAVTGGHHPVGVRSHG